jgi:phosphoglycerate dehydrogenase-like enzyme
MILALAKRLPELDRKTKAGDWQARFSTSIGDLEGATLGIVGFGQIGRELAKLVRPFDMRVLVYDPYVPQALAQQAGARSVDLDFLLAQAHFVTLLAPLTKETQGMIDRQRLDLIKPGAILVNLARGALFDSLDTLYDALEGKILSAVGMDVFPQEPPDVSHPIFTHPNVLCTPHAMGLSVRATQRIFTMMSEGMASVLDGHTPDNVINPMAFQISSTGANR